MRDALPTRGFDGWRLAATPAAKAVAAEAVTAVEAGERRQRSRKAADQCTFLATVDALISGAAHTWLCAEPGLFITRSDRLLSRGPQRYRSPAMNSTLPAVLDGLAAAGWLDQLKGDQNPNREVFTEDRGVKRERRPIVIAASTRLIAAIERRGLRFHDFALSDRRELIVLRGTPASHWEKAETIDYEDTSQTHRWRHELREVNTWLAAADIALLGAPHIDTGERRLHRVFTQGRFDCGGRLAGGFWLSLPRKQRGNLRIAGEPVATIDFANLYARLCFALSNVAQPTGDLYAVALPGIGPEHRAGLKRLVNARLFDVAPRTRWPKRTDSERNARLRPYPGVSVAQVLMAIEAQHPDLAKHFGHGIGHSLMHLESELILGVLRAAMRAGLSILPLHDAVLCPASRATEAVSLVRAASKELLGAELPTSVT